IAGVNLDKKTSAPPNGESQMALDMQYLAATVEFAHRLLAEVAPRRSDPVVLLLHQDGAGEPNQRRSIRKDPNHIASPAETAATTGDARTVDSNVSVKWRPP